MEKLFKKFNDSTNDTQHLVDCISGYHADCDFTSAHNEYFYEAEDKLQFLKDFAYDVAEFPKADIEAALNFLINDENFKDGSERSYAFWALREKA